MKITVSNSYIFFRQDGAKSEVAGIIIAMLMHFKKRHTMQLVPAMLGAYLYRGECSQKASEVQLFPNSTWSNIVATRRIGCRWERRKKIPKEVQR